MEKKKTPEEILETVVLTKFQAMSFLADGKSIIIDKKLIYKAMLAFHSQFNISDEEMEKELKQESKDTFEKLPEYAKSLFLSGAKWMRDKIFETEK